MTGRQDVESKAMLARLDRLRIDQSKSTHDDYGDGDLDLVTLMQNTCGGQVYDPSRSSRFSSSGYKFARSRGRRKSKEFEDLLIHTTTGSLHFAHKKQGFMQPKTSGSRRPPLDQQTTKHNSANCPKGTLRLQRSVSDGGDRRLRASKDDESGFSKAGSPSSRRHLKGKLPVSPLASSATPRHSQNVK